jgi:hypothetical protein
LGSTPTPDLEAAFAGCFAQTEISGMGLRLILPDSSGDPQTWYIAEGGRCPLNTFLRDLKQGLHYRCQFEHKNCTPEQSLPRLSATDPLQTQLTK